MGPQGWVAEPSEGHFTQWGRSIHMPHCLSAQLQLVALGAATNLGGGASVAGQSSLSAPLVCHMYNACWLPRMCRGQVWSCHRHSAQVSLLAYGTPPATSFAESALHCTAARLPAWLQPPTSCRPAAVATQLPLRPTHRTTLSCAAARICRQRTCRWARQIRLWN